MSDESSHPFAAPYRWYHELKQLFVQSIERCRAGEINPAAHYTPVQTNYLASIGMTPQELFDFADDHTRYGGDPDWETVLLISAVRREYFLSVLNGKLADKTVSMDDLPAKDVKLGGIPWLPRLIQKAKAKLHGEMPADLMYNCAGDRNFFRTHGLNPLTFCGRLG